VALAAIFASQSGLSAPSGSVARVVAAALRKPVAITAATLGLWKILIGLAIAAIGTGLVVYGARQLRPPAASSIPVSQMSRAGQTATASAGSSSQLADNSGLGQRSPSSNEADAIKKNREDFYGRMSSDPEFRASMIALAKSRLDLFYGPLFKNLNLAPDKLDRFKDLLVELDLIYNDVHDALKIEGLNILPPGRSNAYTRDLDYKVLLPPVVDKIKALLTDQEYAQFVDYNEDLGNWYLTNAVARVAESMGTPLTDEQANLLVVIFRRGQPKSSVLHWLEMYYATGLSTPPPGSSGITASIVEKAKGILSPSQVDAIRQVQATWGTKWL
jgi:hypothetical protein